MALLTTAAGAAVFYDDRLHGCCCCAFPLPESWRMSGLYGFIYISGTKRQRRILIFIKVKSEQNVAVAKKQIYCSHTHRLQSGFSSNVI